MKDQRALYYWARLHQEQLKKGKDFRVLRPTIAVCSVDTPLFPEIDDYHLTFELREQRHQVVFTDQMAVHILELTKFRKTLEELTTPSIAGCTSCGTQRNWIRTFCPNPWTWQSCAGQWET